MMLMVFLQQVRQKLRLLYLGNQREVKLLEYELDLNLRQVLLTLVQLHLRLRELSREEYVQFQCNCGQVVAPHEVKVRELFSHEV